MTRRHPLRRRFVMYARGTERGTLASTFHLLRLLLPAVASLHRAPGPLYKQEWGRSRIYPNLPRVVISYPLAIGRIVLGTPPSHPLGATESSQFLGSNDPYPGFSNRCKEQEFDKGYIKKYGDPNSSLILVSRPS